MVYKRQLIFQYSCPSGVRYKQVAIRWPQKQIVLRWFLKSSVSLLAPVRFKGLKPSRLLFPDGSVVTVQNWRQAILEILRECNKDPIRHDRMMRLCDLVAGRLRPLLSGSPKGMNVPVMIDEGLYLEGKLDTEYLIKTVRDQILNPAGYDYDKIGLAVYDPKQEMVQKSQSMQM